MLEMHGDTDALSCKTVRVGLATFLTPDAPALSQTPQSNETNQPFY